VTQPLTSLLDTSEDLMPMPARQDARELLADARDQIEAAMRDRKQRGRRIREAVRLLKLAEGME
jgi:ElaB/YqjD/DUF883 family membrane-anchored ribosome-binding protein